MAVYDNWWGNTQNQNLGTNQNNAGLSWWMNANRGRYPNPVMPSNLTQDLGASTIQAPVPQAIGGTDIDMQYTTGNEFNIPLRRNILSRFGSGVRNVAGDLVGGAGNFAGDLVSGAKNIYGDVRGGITNILDNTILGRIAAMRDATNPRAANYNPALQGQIDFLRDQGVYANTRAGNKITGGALAGQNLQSMYGSNDLIDMYNKQIAKHDKTIQGFSDQWGSLEEEDPKEYARRLAIHQKRKSQAEEQKAAIIAGTTGGGAAVTTTGGAVATGGGAAERAERDRQGGYNPSARTFRAPGNISQATSRAARGDPQGTGGGWKWATGGRVGYREGEFVDENINVEGPGFDVNENIEMASSPHPDESWLGLWEELDDKGMVPIEIETLDDFKHWFHQQDFDMGSMSEDQGIASLV